MSDLYTFVAGEIWMSTIVHIRFSRAFRRGQCVMDSGLGGPGGPGPCHDHFETSQADRR